MKCPEEGNGKTSICGLLVVVDMVVFGVLIKEKKKIDVVVSLKSKVSA